MGAVWETTPEARLLLVGGRTAYTAEIESMIAGLGDARRHRVHLLSDVDEDFKASLLAASDVFALPSALDSFGLAFLEAWACRKPVVGVATGAISSFVDDGEDGLLVPYEDPAALAAAIGRLLAAPELARRMGEAGLAKVRRRFSWEIVGGEIRAAYLQAIAGRGPQAGAGTSR